jgi:O-antigen ligase
MINISKFRQLDELKSIPVWLPLILGTLLGVVVAYLAFQQEWVYLMVLLLLVPTAILFYVYPFSVVLIWLLVFPFFLKEVLPGARTIYWILYRLMIPAAVIALLFLSVTGIRKIRGFRIGLVDWIMVGYIVYSLANIFLLTPQPESLLIRYYDRIFVPFCMYWLIRLLNPDAKDLKLLLPVALILILSQAAVGIFSWTAPEVLPRPWLSRLGERTVGTFGNPAVLSTTLMFCALFLMQAYHETKSSFLRWASLAGVVLAFFLVFFSFSRGSWLGGAVVLLGMACIYPKTVMRLVLAGLIIAAILYLASPLRSYFGFAEERLTTESTVEGRIIGASATTRLILEKPLFGWGYNQHERYDEQFRESVFNLAVNNQHSSHNTYLLITAEMGVIGLALYLLPVLIWLVRSVKVFKKLPFKGYPGQAIVIMLWLVLVDQFIASNFTDLIQSTLFNTVMWWLVLGLIANIVDSVREERSLAVQPLVERTVGAMQ